MTSIVFFNQKGFLSQGYKCDISIDNVEYNCVEQYVMAERARFFKDKQQLTLIMRAVSPRLQRKAGQRVKGYTSRKWNKVAREIVYRGHKVKFDQHPKLRQKLLSTGDKILVFSSPRDTFWGIGMSKSHKYAKRQRCWRGHNHLGKILMDVRFDHKYS